MLYLTLRDLFHIIYHINRLKERNHTIISIGEENTFIKIKSKKFPSKWKISEGGKWYYKLGLKSIHILQISFSKIYKS